MAFSIPLVWTDAHRLHDPDAAVWIGVPVPADELPQLLDTIDHPLVRTTLEGLEEGVA